jgi:phosphoribosylanthranilate isomerase
VVRKVKVKICGITNLKDARASIEAGADALGFVFYRRSPRYIAPEAAAEIIKKLPKGLKKVGVFVNEKQEAIRRIAKLCKLDMLQFHGHESPGFCARFKDYKVIKAFRVKDSIDEGGISQYNTFAYLFDAFKKGEFGGTGQKFNWGLIRHKIKRKRPIFLSGGLRAGNVKDALKCVQPEWVDVSSSLEINPGKKDRRKIKEFIKITKRTNDKIQNSK